MTAPTGAPAALITQRCAQNPFYKTAIETPALLRVLELRDKAMSTRAVIKPPPSVPPPPTADAIDTWLDTVTQVSDYARNTADKTQALDSLITSCDMQIQGHTVNVEPRVAALAKELPAVLASIRDAVERLDGAHTPTEAIAAGKGDVWNEIHTEHLTQWDAFWQAFDWITSEHQLYHRARSQYLLDDDLASRSRIRNISSIFPAWQQPSRDTALQGWGTSDPRPWPTDRVSQLIWVVTSGAEVWAPTPQQLREPHPHQRNEPIADTDIDARRGQFAEMQGVSE
jgi:hypothetical protein